MNYPKWAPLNLINLHVKRLENPQASVKGDESMSDFFCKPEISSNQQLKHVQVNPTKSSNDYSPIMGTELLGKMLTDERMKKAWASIAKRVKHEGEFIQFWNTCNMALLGWRGEQKLSPTQRKKLFKRIHSLAFELSQAMMQTIEYKFYSINDLADNERIKDFIELLQVPPLPFEDEAKDLDYVRFFLAEVTPDIRLVLSDIGDKAMQISNKKPLALKPNSEKAGLHFFVRTLSQYLSKKYGQPLHEVVATTAGVVFDQQDVDSNYVRSLL